MIEVKNTLNGEVNASIVKEYPELEEITVTPTLDGQELKPSKYGYSKVTINEIPATDITITPTTKEQKQEGIFKTVKVNAIEGEELNLNPSEEQQNYEGVFRGVNINPIQTEEITADLDFSSSDAIELKAQEGVYIKKAIINKDANLTPENIKSGVTISGVSGDVADTSDADATSNDIISGKTAYVGNQKIEGTFEPLDTSDATATAEDIVKDKTAYVNGEKITGTLKNNYNAKLMSAYSGAFKLDIVEYDFTNVDTSKVMDMSTGFAGNENVEKIIGLDTTNVTYMYQAFNTCAKLHTLCELEAGKFGNITDMFIRCISLTNLGGLKNLGKGYLNGYNSTVNYPNYSLRLHEAQGLTHESLMNVINGLYDLNLNTTIYQRAQKLQLGSANLAKLTPEEIAIATNKKWNVS